MSNNDDNENSGGSVAGEERSSEDASNELPRKQDLFEMVERGNADQVRRILDRMDSNFDINACRDDTREKYSALHTACKLGDVDIVHHECGRPAAYVCCSLMQASSDEAIPTMTLDENHKPGTTALTRKRMHAKEDSQLRKRDQTGNAWLMRSFIGAGSAPRSIGNEESAMAA